MIDIPTVLILGAGSNAHIGYPLGTQLISQIVNQRPKSADELPEGWSLEEVSNFITDLSRSEYGSIDAFLGSDEYSGQSEIGKFLIARTLKQCENLDRLFLPHDNGWYSSLFFALLDQRNKCYGDRLKVVTFNYDRSLEAYLATVLHHRFKIATADASAMVERVPIAHVHGVLGKLNEFPYEATVKSPNELMQIASQIQTINEIEDCAEGFCNAEFERASTFLEEAERVLILGFGFHENNVQRLQFFKPEAFAKRRIRSTAHGIHAAALDHLSKRLASYGFTKECFTSTDCTSFLRTYELL